MSDIFDPSCYRKKKMIRHFPVLLIFLLVFCNFSFSKDLEHSGEDTLKSNSNQPAPLDLIKYDFNRGLLDGWRLLTAPSHFSGKNWAVTGAITGGTALSMLLDKGIRKVARSNQSNSLDDITKAGQYYGMVIPAASLSAGLYAAGLIFNDRSVSLTGRLLAESLLYAGTINIILKVLFSRSRPYNNDGNTDFGNYVFDNAYYSLPSGHAIVAFTVSTVLAERIQNIFATIGLYSLATLTAYQRIYSDNHWFSDTVLGAAIAIVISRSVVEMSQSDPYENNNPDISVYPALGGYRIGLNFSF
jgi:membrane-associated phospholipid phosphatase